MSLNERIMQDMKSAMKDRENGKLRLTVIRMIRSEIKNAEINQKKDLTDDEILGIISKGVKQRRDSIPEYEKGGRPDVVETLNREIDILMAYLPEQLTEDEIKDLVRKAAEETGASAPSDMGKLMGKIMPLVKGKADGKVVNRIVKEHLENA